MTTRTRARVVMALLGAGLLARLTLGVLAVRGPYDPYTRLHGDMGKYLAVGVSLQRGEGFSRHYEGVLPQVFAGQSVAAGPATPTASLSPGYPLFLAGAFMAFGYRLELIVVLQMLMSTLTAVFVYLIAREVRIEPLWPFGFALFYYPFIFDSAYMLTECLLTCSTSATLWFLVRQPRGFVAGVAAGVTVLVKSVTLPFLALAPLIQPTRRIWLFWAGLGLVLLPWAYRNYAHTGTPYVTASYAGYQLLQLHNPANRDFPLFDPPGDLNEGYAGLPVVLDQAKRLAPPREDPVAREYATDRASGVSALRFIRAEPWQFVRAVAHSVANTWRIDYPHANWIRWANSLVLYVGLMPLVCWGAVSALRNGPPGARLLVLFLLYFVASHAVVASEIRYRISAMPAYFVLAGFGIQQLQQLRSRRTA